jgi:sulfatase maturation enzyme AslB (radical SAM superfamily)
MSTKRTETPNEYSAKDRVLQAADIRSPAAAPPSVPLHGLDALWFQVGGTICNLWCTHCFISCSPQNHKFGFMSRQKVRRYLEESISHGVKEYYFTGGEPFMNREMLQILEDTLKLGPATVLTNCILINERVAGRLQHLEQSSRYSLEIRVSLDGFTAESNDVIRGEDSFRKAMVGIKNLVDRGFLPIITATQTWDDGNNEEVLRGFQDMLFRIGYDRPRIKIIPPLRIGRERVRSRGYDRSESVTHEMMAEFDDHLLICSQSRTVTDKGVYVCPILIDSPDARLGDTLEEAHIDYPLRHSACYTCYLSGAICHNFPGSAEG